MKEIETGADISNIVKALRLHFGNSREIWFRGQPKYDYKLVPGLFRQGVEYGCEFDEFGMYEEFVRRHPEHNVSHRSIPDWLTLMQHYRMPTRLLDWTSNLLIALYFACSEHPSNDGAVFGFNPGSFYRYGFNPLLQMQVTAPNAAKFYDDLIFRNGGMLNDDSSINGVSIRAIKSDLIVQQHFVHPAFAERLRFGSVTIKQQLSNTRDVDGNAIESVDLEIVRAFSNIVPMKHAHLNSRAKQQSGLFTLHGGKFFRGEAFINPLGFENHPDFTANGVQDLLKVVIRSGDKLSLLEELSISGIRECTLFPEMEYQAKDIKNNNTKLLRRAQE